MSGIDQTIIALWQIVRDDEHDAFQVIDASERVIATVPVGISKTDTIRQRHVRDLVVSAPVLLATIRQVLAELEKDKPNTEVCRSMLSRAVSAARGEL